MQINGQQQNGKSVLEGVTQNALKIDISADVTISDALQIETGGKQKDCITGAERSKIFMKFSGAKVTIVQCNCSMHMDNRYPKMLRT